MRRAICLGPYSYVGGSFSIRFSGRYAFLDENLILIIHSCKFTIGRLLMFEGKYEAAESVLLECQSMWLQGDRSRALDFNGIIVYQLGCCALMQGNTDAAL